MTMLEGRPAMMSSQTVLAIVALVWTIVIGLAAYSFGQGGDSQRMINLENDVKDLQSYNIAITSLSTRVVTLENGQVQLTKDQAAGFTRGQLREEQLNTMRDRVTKIEAGFESLLEGQRRIESLLERKFGYQESRDDKSLEQEFRTKP